MVAEEVGYDSVLLTDHMHSPAPIAAPVLECWTSVAAVAGATSKVRIGQMVTYFGFRAPALLAKMAASVDSLSAGRLEVGLGAGWYRSETEAYGLAFEGAAGRLDRLEEYIRILQLMWREEVASFEGRYFTIKGARCDPKPVRGTIPLWIGGGGIKRTIPLVARYADGANFSGELPDFKTRVDALRAHCESNARDFADVRVSLPVDVAIAADRESAQRQMDFHHGRLQRQDLSAFEGAPLVYSVDAIGTPEDVIEVLTPYLREGATDLAVWFADFPDTAGMELFAREVLPRLQG